MKTVKELKASANERFISCCGENAAIFLIMAGTAAFMVLLWMIFAELIGNSPLPQNISGGIIIIFTQIIFIVLMLLITPFLYGVKWYRIQQVRGNNVPAESIFRCYTSSKRLSGLYRFSIEATKKRMKFIVPIALVLGTAALLTAQLRKTGGLAKEISSFAMLLLIFAAFFVTVKFNSRYMAASYLYVLDPEVPPKELIRRSEEISDGKTDYIIKCMFSVSWWLLTFIFVFPAIFAFPYMEMICTAAVNEVIEASGKTADGIGEEKTKNVGKEYSHS